MSILKETSKVLDQYLVYKEVKNAVDTCVKFIQIAGGLSTSWYSRDRRVSGKRIFRNNNGKAFTSLREMKLPSGVSLIL